MTSNVMEYRGFIALIQFSAEDDEFYGRVLDIDRHIISFGGKTVRELKKHFKESVDGYLEFCKEEGIEPKKPFSGRITYRTSPQQHAKLSQLALEKGQGSINSLIDQAVAYYTSHVLERRT